MRQLTFYKMCQIVNPSLVFKLFWCFFLLTMSSGRMSGDHSGRGCCWLSPPEKRPSWSDLSTRSSVAGFDQDVVALCQERVLQLDASLLLQGLEGF